GGKRTLQFRRVTVIVSNQETETNELRRAYLDARTTHARLPGGGTPRVGPAGHRSADSLVRAFCRPSQTRGHGCPRSGPAAWSLPSMFPRLLEARMRCERTGQWDGWGLWRIGPR